MRKTICVLLFALISFSVVFANAVAESSPAEWPSKNVEVVIPAGTGGDTDTTSRVLCQELTNNLGQTFSVSNKSGGSGSIACDYMYESKADGHTVLYWHTDMIFSTLIGGTGKSWQDAFKIVGSTGGGQTTCIFVNKSNGWKTMNDFVKYAKAHPGEVVVGTEIGSSNHILILQFAQALGLDLNIVQIGSGSARSKSLLSNEIDVNFSIYGTCADFVTSGDFYCLGLCAEKENDYINKAVGAKVPTIGEATGKDVVDVDFYIIAVQKDCDDAIVEKFSAEVKKAAESEAYKNVLAKYFFNVDVKLGQEAVDNMNYWANYYKDAAAIYLAQKN